MKKSVAGATNSFTNKQTCLPDDFATLRCCFGDSRYFGLQIFVGWKAFDLNYIKGDVNLFLFATALQQTTGWLSEIADKFSFQLYNCNNNGRDACPRVF